MTDQTEFTAELAERTVVVTWPDNKHGGATPPPDGWQDRAWEESTLHEIDEGSITGCSVLRWRDDPRSDAELTAVSLALVSGKPTTPAGQAPATDRAAVLREAADRYEVILTSAVTVHSADPRYYTGVRDVILGLRRMAVEVQQPTPPSEDCTCIPFTRQGGTPRYCQPGDTVDMISGWEIGGDCPHHRAAVKAQQPGARS